MSTIFYLFCVDVSKWIFCMKGLQFVSFKGFPAVVDELDLIDEEDQITHTLSLEDPMNPENELSEIFMLF